MPEAELQFTCSTAELWSKMKVYAEELGGNEIISFNFYRPKKDGLLRTCEMPEEKVITFLKEYEIL